MVWYLLCSILSFPGMVGLWSYFRGFQCPLLLMVFGPAYIMMLLLGYSLVGVNLAHAHGVLGALQTATGLAAFFFAVSALLTFT